MLENPTPTKRRAKSIPSVSLNIDSPESDNLKPRITIFGVGGAGGNAINNMMRSKLEGVEFVAANTDAQALNNSLTPNRIQLGLKATKGLGAGSFPDRGRAAAEENLDEIAQFLEGNNMVFIAAGMGGGTGTGGAPVIAKLARERDILTVGVVTKPFHFEGKYRMEIAEAGIEELKKYVDTLIIIPNQNLFRIANEHTTFESAFKMADDVLQAGVRGITDLITMPGLVNLDFADIRTIMTKMGKAMMGTGEAEGENRAIVACEAAVSNPLLDDISIKGAKGVLVNMTGGPDMTLFEADMAVNAIRKEVDSNANIIFGSAFNENMKGKIRISVVATGIDGEDFRRESVKTNFEPSRFKVESEEKPSAKNFFDPGISVMPEEEEVEEISEVDFKPKKSDYKKSEPFFEMVEEVSVQEEGFFEVEKEDPAEEIKSVAKPIKSKPKAKKENSGFSLFSFMNPSKNTDDSVKNEEKDEPENQVFAEEFAIEETPIKKSPSAKKEDLEKKRQQFFGSTVFDEGEEEKTEVRFDDDILNVPAFFRRKK
ncbi:MAG: cell division protein FtsZ [Proteobacteria bacterium]|nr:cell division protein FtsZ [Pseudomonadota bacterium]